MAKKILISFVGGRPLPNIQFILKEKPDKLYLISSVDSAGTRGNKEKLIDALPQEFKPYKTFDVNPYAINETIEKCKEILSENSSDEIILQLSSEPTTMALGAYKFVLNNSNSNISLYYSSRDGIIDVLQESIGLPKKIDISLKDYFKVYGWTIKINQMIDENFSKLVELFNNDILIAHSLLFKIRQNNKGKGKRTITIPKLEGNEFYLLKQMEQRGFVSNVSDKPNVSFIVTDEQATFFIKGDWLEYLMYKTAKEKLSFDECAWNVEDVSQKGELDFVGILNGQLVIASCKTENSIKSEYLKELSARADQLGKGMCTKMFITSYCPSDISQYEKWSKEYNVSIVYGQNLKDLDIYLKKAIEDRGRI